MGLMRFNYRSEIIGMTTDITICYPTGMLTVLDRPPVRPVEKGGVQLPAPPEKFKYVPGMKFQTVWFLHGGGDDDTTAYRFTSLERYAEENQVLLVTPSVRDSMYVNTEYGIRYMDYITDELPKVIRALFPVSEKREDNFIMGFAMGGNGALAIGMIHPELYSGIVDLSGGIGLTLDRDVYREQMTRNSMGRNRLVGCLKGADDFENTDHDLRYIAEKDLAEGKDVPPIFIGVGEKDFVQPRVKKDYEHLKNLGFNVYYEEGKDLGHEWDFWDLYFKKSLSQWLPLKKKPIYPGEE